jgi:NADPH2:quinone reductase
MRAVRFEAFGGPEVLVPVELPDPVPGPGQVLINVEAAGVNRADALIRAGRYHRAGRPPLVLGLEGAGTIAGLGSGVTGLHVGQKVLAQGEAGAPGFYAEKAVVDAERVTVVPEAVSALEAAALPVAWLSAWYSLHRLGHVQAGQYVLIHAAASGVGSAAVQLAVAAGAQVIAAAGGAAKTDWVAKLGAAHVLDSQELSGVQLVERVTELTGGRGADFVLDTVGGDVFAHSLKAVGFGGTVVAMANVALAPSTIDTRDFYPKNVAIHGYQATGLIEHGYDPRPDLEQLLGLLADGSVHVPIDTVYALEDAADAHRRLEDRGVRGKVLLSTGAAEAAR